MTRLSAPFSQTTRLAACLAAAGFLLSAAPALAQTRLPAPAYGNADARQDRIEELERQLTEATAENERLQYEVMQRDREIQRLRGMVGELAGVNQDLSAGPPPEDSATAPAASGGARPSSDEQSSLSDAQRRATGTLGSMSASAAPSAQPVVEAGDQYSRARELLVNGEYAEAEEAFGALLEQHPDAEQAPDARYWFAFTQLARNNYRDAASNFTGYLRANRNGPRAAEAQVRLGMALVGLSEDGQNDAAERRQACAAFAQLPANAPRNVRDLAAREARAAQCAA